MSPVQIAFCVGFFLGGVVCTLIIGIIALAGSKQKFEFDDELKGGTR